MITLTLDTATATAVATACLVTAGEDTTPPDVAERLNAVVDNILSQRAGDDETREAERMSTYISLGINTDGTPNSNPTTSDLDVAPGTDVAVDMLGRDIRLAIDPGGCVTYMQPTEARRLATYLEYAATECEKRDHATRD